MIFTALSFLQLIYGLFFTRRKCQLDSMERPHYIKYLAVYIKHISILNRISSKILRYQTLNHW